MIVSNDIPDTSQYSFLCFLKIVHSMETDPLRITSLTLCQMYQCEVGHMSFVFNRGISSLKIQCVHGTCEPFLTGYHMFQGIIYIQQSSHHANFIWSK